MVEANADEPETGAPSPTWDTLVAGLNLAPHELAHQLQSQYGTPDFAHHPSEFVSLTTPATNGSATALLLRQSSAEERTYTLVALQDCVAVLYDLKEMFELNAQGGRYGALVGETRKVSGQLIFPSLYHQPDATSRTAHRDLFKTREVPAQSWDEIAEALETDATSTLVTPAIIPEGQEGAPVVHAHMALPLPPYLALLFLRMPSFRAAFGLVHTLRGIIPENQHGAWDPLFTFMRAAITQDTETPTQSAMRVEWAQMSIQAGTQLETILLDGG